MRLFVVAGSETQRSRRTISVEFGRMILNERAGAARVVSLATVSETRLVGVDGDERMACAIAGRVRHFTTSTDSTSSMKKVISDPLGCRA